LRAEDEGKKGFQTEFFRNVSASDHKRWKNRSEAKIFDHIFEVAEVARQSLIQTNHNQTILIQYVPQLNCGC